MIVVAIIALLAAIAIPNLVRSRVTANDAAAKAALKSISTSLETYLATNTVYPTDTTTLVGDTPPYLTTDYFTGSHEGFTFSMDVLTDYTYQASATPVGPNLGTSTFTITTGSVTNWQ